MTNKIDINGPSRTPAQSEILTPEAVAFLYELHSHFNDRRISLIRMRQSRQTQLDQGSLPDFVDDTKSIRTSDWTVSPPPADLERRLVEITGPADAKMMINALNSGADGFMVDLEDAMSPTWSNVIQGQKNIFDAVRGQLTYHDSQSGKDYRLSAEQATLLVRPRGWHLPEKHVTVAGEPLSASLFDFGLALFHNGKELVKRGSGPYFYLPKLESHMEARLWNDVFVFAQSYLGIAHGTIKATVLIETILAAFEMDEILFELKDHSAGLNAGRWDYIFSIIKKFKNHPDKILPNRDQVTMTTPFMHAYTELLVQTCHRRGAHAMGGMAAFIPSRRDLAINQAALDKVAEDKQREARAGFDGTWVAHPDLVAVAREQFTKILGDAPHQKACMRQDVKIGQKDLLDFRIEGGTITEEGLSHNIRVALQYMDRWLNGQGAVALDHLMEDAATAEISRAQLWQWVHSGSRLKGGQAVTPEVYKLICQEEVRKLIPQIGQGVKRAAHLLDGLTLGQDFTDFLTLPAYDSLSDQKV